MKLELNYYKESGKWYTKEIENLPIDYGIDDVEAFIKDKKAFKDMLVTIHVVIDSDEAGEVSYKQPYRFFKL